MFVPEIKLRGRLTSMEPRSSNWDSDFRAHASARRESSKRNLGLRHHPKLHSNLLYKLNAINPRYPSSFAGEGNAGRESENAHTKTIHYQDTWPCGLIGWIGEVGLESCEGQNRPAMRWLWTQTLSLECANTDRSHRMGSQWPPSRPVSSTLCCLRLRYPGVGGRTGRT